MKYARTKQSEIQYEEILTGGHSRLSGAKNTPHKEYQMIWNDIGQEQVDLLTGLLNKKVEIINHLLESEICYIDSIEKQFLITLTGEPRYGLQLGVVGI